MAERIPGLQFEMQRRVILFRSTTTMPDGSTLGYNSDPNNAVNDNTPGETLLYNCPVGTRYQEDNGTQWIKQGSPNTWKTIAFQGDGTGDKNFSINITHKLEAVIEHNLNKYPAVSILDSDNMASLSNIEYIDNNHIKVIFKEPFTGKVTFN